MATLYKWKKLPERNARAKMPRLSSIGAFIEEYMTNTEPNPFSNRERVWQRRACFSLHEWSDGDLNRISLVGIRSLQRGCGDGSAALDWLCDLADKHGVMLTGIIQPNGLTRPRLTLTQLRAWYRSRNFVVTKDDWMCRLPAIELPPQAEERKRNEASID